jgi:glc operon protein GlcG
MVSQATSTRVGARGLSHRQAVWVGAALALSMLGAKAQNLPYGRPIELAMAKQVAQAAAAEMTAKGLGLTIAVVDSGGNLLYLERSDLAGIGSIEPAIGKAKAANGIKTSTKVIGDLIVNQKLMNLIAVPGAMPVEGGLPLIFKGQVVGAIGVSGGTPEEDGAIARVGARVLQR